MLTLRFETPGDIPWGLHSLQRCKGRRGEDWGAMLTARSRDAFPQQYCSHAWHIKTTQLKPSCCLGKRTCMQLVVWTGPGPRHSWDCKSEVKTKNSQIFSLCGLIYSPESCLPQSIRKVFKPYMVWHSKKKTEYGQKTVEYGQIQRL